MPSTAPSAPANGEAFKDTFYDFFRWLYLYGFMAVKLGCHPILMVKSMLRYRWMVS